MLTYPLLKSTHIALVLASGLGFALRGYLRLVRRRTLHQPLLRWGPHLLDTLLLATGATLWWMLALSPLSFAWFGLKLLLVLVYIGLGMGAFRHHDPTTAVRLYLAALACFCAIVALALGKPL